MTDAKVQKAATNYASGSSLASVAAEFDICERTLRREFAAAGVVVRPRSGARAKPGA